MEVAELLERHRAFWHRESVDRPLITPRRFVPLAPRSLPVPPDVIGRGDVCLRPEMLDVAALHSLDHGGPQSGPPITGDSFALRAPSNWIPWAEAILGCGLIADSTSGSVWTEPILKSAEALDGLARARNEDWYQKLLEYTRLLVELNDGSYLVTIAGLRGPLDLARALLGAETMCLAVHDSPTALCDLMDSATDTLIEMASGQLALIPPFHGGYATFGIWAPGTVVYTQADTSALLSDRTYADLVMPSEVKLCRHFDHSIMHLHSGYPHILDALLDSELPTAIEIWLDTGFGSVPSAVDLISVCRRILERKPLLLDGPMTTADLAYFAGNLPPRGLAMRPQLVE